MKQLRRATPLGFWEKLMAHIKSSRNLSKYQSSFKDIKTYCMFLGYPRSGHSLIGSLLDAHPNMIIAHELDALKYIEAGFNRDKLFTLLIERSKEFNEQGGQWAGYEYSVSDQWNGRFQDLNIIGDKKGGRSCLRLIKNPDLFEELRSTVDMPIKFIHITRNPYDNITTMFTKKKAINDLDYKIEKFFMLCEGIKNLKEKIPQEDFLELKLEDFILDAKPNLRKICDFLGENVSEDYLESCQKLVFKKPKNTRDNIEWPPEVTQKVDEYIAKYDFMQGYSFEN